MSADSPSAAGASGETPDADARVRVLVVDDNVDGADTFGLLLETFGCVVRTAYTGADALAAAQAFAPALVFLDLGLPDMTGLQVCERLRRACEGQDVVICAVTGWGRAADRDASARAGFDHHLVKPVEPDRVRPLVEERVARARALGAAAANGRATSAT